MDNWVKRTMEGKIFQIRLGVDVSPGDGYEPLWEVRDVMMAEDEKTEASIPAAVKLVEDKSERELWFWYGIAKNGTTYVYSEDGSLIGQKPLNSGLARVYRPSEGESIEVSVYRVAANPGRKYVAVTWSFFFRVEEGYSVSDQYTELFVEADTGLDVTEPGFLRSGMQTLLKRAKLDTPVQQAAKVFREFGGEPGENMHELDSGKTMIRSYGKYNPGLVVILPKVEKGCKDAWIRDAEERAEKIRQMNITTDGEPKHIIRGLLYKSKKGAFCWKPDVKGPHAMLIINWGGSGNHTRGCPSVQSKEEGALYYRRASSNGGGIGTTYLVLPWEFRQQFKEDAI